ncbi:MAG TPA: hypothetical protein K8V11_04835 [Dietzia timorensis]|uniref:HipA-like C-terminal domain-containing protein n=1 Tax=Dietzia timorensis TaxID=499555 RepID=A0A921F3S2_9ACTN|nr:hypothetical protein [Dietzia timorensis]HJE90313.1 hypothetical protein [Dietzia timorensis]
MPEIFRVENLDTWIRGEVESAGATEKRWFRDPSSDGGRWLFKPHTFKELKLSKERVAKGDAPDFLRCGEHWAEKISFEIAELLAVPSAVTRLAKVHHHTSGELLTGSMSLDFAPSNWEFAPGATILSSLDPEFDTDKCIGHTLEAVHQSLRDLGGPPDSAYSEWQAFDVWAGYLLLDALIANTDRHAHNWAILQRPNDGREFLAPSFDHGSSLGSKLDDSFRAPRTDRSAAAAWCEKGNTRKFDGGARNSLVYLAERGLSMCSEDSRKYWVERLNSLDLGQATAVVDSVPDLSESTSTFIKNVLEVNLRRLRHALD